MKKKSSLTQTAINSLIVEFRNPSAVKNQIKRECEVKNEKKKSKRRCEMIANKKSHF